MIKGAKNKRILIPKNSIKTPSKSSENKVRKGKKRKGAESCRIEKYLKNVEKFNYPGSSLSILNQDSTHFATIDSHNIKIFKKNKKVNISNLSKKIKKRQDTESIKSGEYQVDSVINLTNCKVIEKHSLQNFVKIKRNSETSDSTQMKKFEKAYKVKHNNSKKRSNSKSKPKQIKAKYQLSSYVEKVK